VGRTLYPSLCSSSTKGEHEASCSSTAPQRTRPENNTIAETAGRNTATQSRNTPPGEHAWVTTEGERIGEGRSRVEPKTQARYTKNHAAKRRMTRMRGPGTPPARMGLRHAPDTKKDRPRPYTDRRPSARPSIWTLEPRTPASRWQITQRVSIGRKARNGRTQNGNQKQNHGDSPGDHPVDGPRPSPRRGNTMHHVG